MLIQISGCQTKGRNEYSRDTSDSIGKIDSLIQKHYDQDDFHGQVVISHNSEIIYQNNVGLANRTWNIPVDDEVRFDIASLNKSMIAALTLKAVEEELLSLDDRLVDLIANFSYKGQFHSDITLHQLLSHTAGLPDYDAIPADLKLNNFRNFKRLYFSNEDYVNFISQLDPINDPDQQFYYSNFSYHLIAIIIENTYGRPFSEILKEKLSHPLGLNNTCSELNNRKISSKLAEAYTYDKETKQWSKNPFIDLSLGRRIFSTASDLNRWAQVMDNPGYLSAHSLALMQQNHLEHLNEKTSYGYGWVVIDAENKSVMGDIGIDKPYIIHGGSTDGYKAMLVNINKGEYVLSFLSNVGNRTQEVQLTKKIINILID
ncbi:MAG: serine hydrolase domain-containing protein [Lutimonas sp.]